MMKLKALFMSIKNVSLNILKIGLFIGFAILTFMFFRWIGLKGCLGFAIGMFIMAYLLLSQNQYLKFVIDITNSDKYLWEIMNEGKKDEKSSKKNTEEN